MADYLSRPTADKVPADSGLDSGAQALNLSLVPSLSRFLKPFRTINALKETELRKTFTVVRKSIDSSPWQNSPFSLNFKRRRTGQNQTFSVLL